MNTGTQFTNLRISAAAAALLACFLSFASPQASAQQNLVVNPGFETGNFNGWTVGYSEDLSVDSNASFAHSGNYSAAFGSTTGILDTISQNLPTSAGTKYTLSFWLKPSNVDGQFQALWNGSTVFATSGPANGPYVEEVFKNLVATGPLSSLTFQGLTPPSYYYLDDVSVTMQSFLFKPLAITPNQLAVAGALDHSVALNDPGIQNLVNSLYNTNTNYLPQSFDMISGVEISSIFNTAYDVAHIQNSAITNHLAEYQADSENGTGVGLVALDMAAGGKSTADGKDGKGSKTIVQPTTDNRWGFFATANGDYTDINGDFNSNGFQYATEGLTVGADYRLTQNLVLGGYLAYEHSFTTLVNNGAIDANGVTGGLYGSWFSNGFYVDGIVGGGYSGFTERRLSVGGNTRGDGDDALLNAAINGGYDMHRGPWTYGPQVGLEYDNVYLDGFTENGSLAPLSVAAQDEDSLRSTAGAHLSYTTHMGGVTVRPDIHAAWQHEYDDAANSLGAGIAGTNAAFVVQGPKLGRDSALAGAGVTVDISEKTSVYANYEGQFGRKNTTQSDVSVGFSTKF